MSGTVTPGATTGANVTGAKEPKVLTPEQRLLSSMRRWVLPGSLATLVVFVVAEAILAGFPPVDGLSLRYRVALSAVLHVQAIFMLVALGLGARHAQSPATDYFFVLTLAPAARVVSLGLPANFTHGDIFVRLLMVLIPLFVGLAVLRHTQHLAPWQAGLRAPRMGSPAAVLWTLLLVVAVPAVAYAEYLLLDPGLEAVTGGTLVFYATILLLSALWQEMVFRGLFVTQGEKAVGAGLAVLLSAVWFTVFQVGTQAEWGLEVAAVLGLAFVSGLIAAAQARATGSIVIGWLVYSAALIGYFLAFPRWL